ncbi:hypothetical protein RJ641_034546 [Dillenia turbinata]|uniref:Late embryogenesis abundant protein LEA-2 subgroup domain-containing protein n=1 Tax=Dillenia turbinata TaxID=194707 RepID=A0AAN8VRD0_9MAGN
MTEVGGCGRCCCTFLVTLGLTALFLWLSLKTSNPSCSIQSFYIPALKKSLDSSNTSINYLLQLKNENKDKGVYYDALDLSFYYGKNRDNFIKNVSLPGFYQGHGNKAKRYESMANSGNFVKKANEDIPSPGKAVFRVDLVTAVRFKIVFFKTKRHHIAVHADVEVDDSGQMVKKKGVKFTSGASKLCSCYPAPAMAFWFLFFYLIFFV